MAERTVACELLSKEFPENWENTGKFFQFTDLD
jgi:hypothetical protein